MYPNTDNMKVIAIIPCLNEERFISEVVTKAIKFVDKVIVVDDGSDDNTSSAAKAAGAEVIKHKKRSGAGAATRTGFIEALQAGADIIVTLDGDGQHDANEIPLLIQPIQDGKADLVIGSRFLCSADVPQYRKFGIDVITGLYNFLRKEKITDGQSGFRAFNRRALQVIDITYPGFEFSIQTLVQARKHHMKIMEVPISCIYHDAGSTQDPITHGLSVAWSVIKIRVNEKFFKTGKSPGR
jgi:glycosyltransferase involved in cell wall biosynthesis